jgi:hypothetical protein
MRSLVPMILALSVFCFTPPAPAQEKPSAPPAELQARVPELEEFHTTIFQLWHTAWPNKDIDMCVGLVPQINEGVAKINSAELSGILRDKIGAWERNVATLNTIAGRYAKAAAARDSVRLLDEAENLHAQYENMVRIIRPPMKELDAFHTDLYMLYHHYGPKQELDKTRETTASLVKKMATLNAAEIPGRYKSKEEAFNTARGKLSASVDELTKIVQGDDPTAISRGINDVHKQYMSLERIFEQ